MEVEKVTLRQIRNLGNYQSRQLEIAVCLSKLDDVEQVTKWLKLEVHRLLYDDSFKDDLDEYCQKKNSHKKKPNVSSSESKGLDEIPF